jgi:hypothetical protein
MSNSSQIEPLIANSYSVIVPLFNLASSKGEAVLIKTLDSIEDSIQFFIKSILMLSLSLQKW